MSDVVAIALITGLATLGGVFIASRAGNKQLNICIKHEKEEAVIERRTKILGSYLEPLRDSLCGFNLYINRCTAQMKKVAPSDINSVKVQAERLNV